jgi:hypothetical protein
MPFVSSTLKSFEKWWSPIFGATGNFNHQILPYGIPSYIYLLVFTISLWIHVKYFIALTKRKSVRRIFLVITGQDYPCQHIDQWPHGTEHFKNAIRAHKHFLLNMEISGYIYACACIQWLKVVMTFHYAKYDRNPINDWFPAKRQTFNNTMIRTR